VSSPNLRPGFPMSIAGVPSCRSNIVSEAERTSYHYCIPLVCVPKFSRGLAVWKLCQNTNKQAHSGAPHAHSHRQNTHIRTVLHRDIHIHTHTRTSTHILAHWYTLTHTSTVTHTHTHTHTHTNCEMKKGGFRYQKSSLLEVGDANQTLLQILFPQVRNSSAFSFIKIMKPQPQEIQERERAELSECFQYLQSSGRSNDLIEKMPRMERHFMTLSTNEH